MKQNVLVSVLIPTYNVEKYIQSAIECVINQTHRDIEIIVVDDGSTDGTYSVLERIKSFEQRLKLFSNKENSGIVKTLNFGLSLCTGEYIVRMDGDDLCDSSKFERQLEFLLNNKDVALVGCDVICIDENNNVLNYVKTSHNIICTKKLLNYVSPVMHIWMCKKEIYTILGGYRELGGSEDYDFLLRLDALGFNFYNLPFYGYSVRLRAGNTQTTKGLSQRKTVNYVRKLYEERLKYKTDTFNISSKDGFAKSYLFTEKLHHISVRLTYKAMKYRGENKYFLFVLCLICSLISPYQIQFYLENLAVKFYLKKYNID
jgi:glycosyltransferase involved in cell wall biosynthesis